MLTHHIITSTLLGSAYVYGFYNVANVVLCIMDIVDFLLPVSAAGSMTAQSWSKCLTDCFRCIGCKDVQVYGL